MNARGEIKSFVILCRVFLHTLRLHHFGGCKTRICKYILPYTSAVSRSSEISHKVKQTMGRRIENMAH